MAAQRRQTPTPDTIRTAAERQAELRKILEERRAEIAADLQ